MEKKSEIVTKLRRATRAGRLCGRFTPGEAHKVVRLSSERSIRTFLPKHRRGNPGGHKPYFRRLVVYELLK